jgi:ATP-binding cassette subfamily B protein
MAAPERPDSVSAAGREISPPALLRGYLRWLRPHRLAIAVLVCISLSAAALQLTQPLFLRFIIDQLLLHPKLHAAEPRAALNLASLAFLAFIALSTALGLLRDYRQRLLNTRLTLRLRRTLLRKMLRLSLTELENMNTGGTLARLTGDVDAVSGFLQMAFISPSISLARLLIALAILLTLNLPLALVASAVIPIAALVSLLHARRVLPIYRAVRGDLGQVDGRVGETFSGIRVVRAFGRESRELLAYVRGRHTIARKELFAFRRELFLWAAWGFVISCVPAAIVWSGGHLVLAGRGSVGDIIAFQWYALLLLEPVWQIILSFSDLQRSLAATERVFEVLALHDDIPDKPEATNAPARVNEIRFENLEFEYRSGLPVLRDFNVTVPGGSVVALVGRSGAGKTTVADLLARFRDPTQGRILINGVDIREFRLRSYRRLLAIVPQELFLFDGSVEENIAYGALAATAHDIERAARLANAHDFIMSMPQQYATHVGPRGCHLSGGQAQRLAIARAILTKPQILILDEATSNLDTESEHAMEASGATLITGCTTFIIAHRLSTIRRADLILVIEGGRIIERGTHQSLMDASSAYYSMVLRQSGDRHNL